MLATNLIGRRVRFRQWYTAHADAVSVPGPPGGARVGRAGEVVAVVGCPGVATDAAGVFKLLVAVAGSGVLYATPAEWVDLVPEGV